MCKAGGVRFFFRRRGVAPALPARSNEQTYSWGERIINGFYWLYPAETAPTLLTFFRFDKIILILPYFRSARQMNHFGSFIFVIKKPE